MLKCEVCAHVDILYEQLAVGDRMLFILNGPNIQFD